MNCGVACLSLYSWTYVAPHACTPGIVRWAFRYYPLRWQPRCELLGWRALRLFLPGASAYRSHFGPFGSRCYRPRCIPIWLRRVPMSRSSARRVPMIRSTGGGSGAAISRFRAFICDTRLSNPIHSTKKTRAIKSQTVLRLLRFGKVVRSGSGKLSSPSGGEGASSMRPSPRGRSRNFAFLGIVFLNKRTDCVFAFLEIVFSPRGRHLCFFIVFCFLKNRLTG